jgi:hypothetical protein
MILEWCQNGNTACSRVDSACYGASPIGGFGTVCGQRARAQRDRRDTAVDDMATTPHSISQHPAASYPVRRSALSNDAIADIADLLPLRAAYE